MRVNESAIHGTLSLIQTGAVPQSMVLQHCATVFHAYISFRCSGLLCDIADALAPQIDSYVASQLDSNVCNILSSLVSVNGSDALQQFDTSIIGPLLAPPLPAAFPLLAKDSVSLQNNSAVDLVDYVLNVVVGAAGDINVNRIFDHFTNGTGAWSANATTLGALLGNASLLEFELPLNGTGVVYVGIDNIAVSGLNSWSQFNMLRPERSYLLRSETATDKLNVTIDFHVHADADPNGPVHDGSLSETGTLRAQLTNCHLLADLALSLSSERIESLDISQLSDPRCLVNAIYSAALTDLQLHTNVSGVQLVADGGDLEADVDAFVNNLFLMLFSSFDGVLPSLITGVVAEPLRSAANAAMAEYLRSAHVNSTCSASVINDAPIPMYQQWAQIVSMSVVGGLWLGIVMAMCAVESCLGKSARDAERQPREQERRPLLRDGSIEVLPDPDSDDAVSVDSNRDPGDVRALAGRDGDAHTNVALSHHPRLHWTVRYSVPLLIVATIGMFFSSNNLAGASVVAIVTMGSAHIEPEPLFQFTLVNSVRDMWNAQVYGLSLLVAVLSGAWVYLKLLLMLVVWFLPPSVMSLSRRHMFLYILDLTGKWSLIDAFVLVQMFVAFRFHLAVPAEMASSGSTPAALDVYVRADFGFFSFVGASFMSLILTHVIVGLSRRAVDENAFSNAEPLDGPHTAAIVASGSTRSGALMSVNDPASPPAAVRPVVRWQSVSARRRLTGRRDITVCTHFGRFMFVFFTLAVGALIVVGSFAESFYFVFGGAAGLAMRYLSGTDTLRLSLIKLGLMITDVAMPTASQASGALALKIIFLSVSFCLPLLHLGMLFVLWLVPMSLRAARYLLFVAEVVSAWAALDVFVVSLLVALFEIRQFAQFIIGDHCDQINALLKQYFSEAFPAGETPTCFDVHTVLLDTTWVLVSAFGAYFVFSWYAMHLCHAALEPEVDERSDSPNSIIPDQPRAVADTDDEDDNDAERYGARASFRARRRSAQHRAQQAHNKSIEARVLCALMLAEEVVHSTRE